MQKSTASLAERLEDDRIPVLDGVRGLALVTVVASHLPVGVARLVPGPLALTQFFVLSGFLITWLLLKERDATGAIAFRAYLLRRALRIVPAYAVFLLVWYGGYTLAGQPPRGWEVAAGVTWTVNYVEALGHRVIGLEHAWSLAVEEQFYLLWPPLLAVLLARGGRRRAAVGLAALIGAVLAWRSYLVLVRGGSLVYAYDAFDTRCDALAMGCLLAVLSRDPRLGRAAKALARHAWLPLVTLAVVVAWQFAPVRLRYGPGLTFDALLVGVLMVQVMMLAERGPVRVLTWRPVRFVGRISYALYLYHPGALAIAASLTFLPLGGRVALGLAGSLAAACASWYLVETPFLRLKKRFGRRSAARPHPVPPAILSPAAAGVVIAD